MCVECRWHHASCLIHHHHHPDPTGDPIQKMSITRLRFGQMASLYINHHYSSPNPILKGLTWNFNNSISSSSGSQSSIRGFKQEQGVGLVQEQGSEGKVRVGQLGGEAKNHGTNRRYWQLIKPMYSHI